MSIYQHQSFGGAHSHNCPLRRTSILRVPIVFLSSSYLFDEAVSWVRIYVCNYREGIRELSEVSDGAKISHTPYCCVATFRYATVSLTVSFRACILNSEVTVSSRTCILK
jgi:hypothetical protein